MAEHSRFFDSIDPLDPDRVYTAEEFTSYFNALITTGIMKGAANMLKVETSGSNMNTTVDTGTAFLVGRQYENDSKLSLTHEIEALGKSRIDRVVLRLVLDMDARYIKVFVKRGAAGSAPIPPPLDRTGDVYEISLAQVKVIGGQTYINVADVIDERGNPDVCPWAGSKILPNFDNEFLLEELVNKANKQQDIPIQATLSAGWNHGSGHLSPLTYYKDQFGVVYLRGNVVSTASAPAQFCVIPAGFRSKRVEALPMAVNEEVTNAIPITSAGILEVNTNGTLFCKVLPFTEKALYIETSWLAE